MKKSQIAIYMQSFISENRAMWDSCEIANFLLSLTNTYNLDKL